jgi:hypothetical protein
VAALVALEPVPSLSAILHDVRISRGM